MRTQDISLLGVTLLKSGPAGERGSRHGLGASGCGHRRRRPRRCWAARAYRGESSVGLQPTSRPVVLTEAMRLAEGGYGVPAGSDTGLRRIGARQTGNYKRESTLFSGAEVR